MGIDRWTAMIAVAALAMTGPISAGPPNTPPAPPPAATAPAIIPPDTPAGRFVATFTAAYNAGDVAALQRWLTAYHLDEPAKMLAGLRARTGPLTPIRIAPDGPGKATALFAQAHSDTLWQVTIAIDAAGRASWDLKPGERPPEFAIPRLPRAQLDAAMDRRLAQDAAADRFSGTILVQRHGRIVYRQAVGLADRAAKVPVTMDSQFRLGSANKMFTAVAVLQLVDRGRISLDAPVGTYLKDYPNADFAKTVTIRQLLSHTGGAGDIFTPEYQAKRLQTRTLADYVALFGARAPDESKEGKGRYANYGFVLLGRIVEVVSGEDYYDYVQRHIFAPAGMTATASLPEDVAVPGRAHGYTMAGTGTLHDNADTLPWRGSAAGGGYSTAGDLVRFADALRGGRLLPPKLLAMATAAQRPDGWYGFGFIVAGKGEMRSWGHGGGAPGMNASFLVYPELDTVVVALANLDPMAADDEANFYAHRMLLKE